MLTSSAEILAGKIKARSPVSLGGESIEFGDLVVKVSCGDVKNFLSYLKSDPELSFNLLVDVTAIDWLDSREERFELVYSLLSLTHLHRVRVKVIIPESSPSVESVVSLWSGANYLECEVYDMYGIRFAGHPDLRRILMYEEFEGFPLRKDYPVQGKQPRIPLRSPEVRNTALDMRRPELVSINRKVVGTK